MPQPTLPIVFRDDEVVVINKPSGLLVHRSPIDKHETAFALQAVRDQIGQRVHAVHRLDKPTSGLLMFALTSDAARHMTAQFTEGLVQKRYVALVRGWPPAQTIDYALARTLEDCAPGKSPSDYPRDAAQTIVQPLAQIELPIANDRYATSRYSLVELTPLTGRRHQLRRHMKHVSHPIVGDAYYGKGEHNRRLAAAYGASRLMLACVGLTWKSIAGAQHDIADAPSEDFMTALAAMGVPRNAVTHADSRHRAT
jgi:tRNA pseudouridine65 synthase